MTEIVQVAGGTADLENFYIGPDRELRVDTSNYDLLIHDGVTPGGHRLLNQDNADERYQAHSVELDGIGPYSAESRGFLVRRGAGDYRLRKITVSSEISVSNPDGYGGDVALSLPTTLDQDHQFSGDIIINGVLQVDGGINANLFGNVTGTLTGNVVGDVVGNLTGNAAGDATGTFTGDVSVVGHSIMFDNAQIPITAINGLLDYIVLHGFPLGGICKWSGAIVDIPAHYALCDGSNGTPNLTDKFIVGAGNAYSVGGTGGGLTATANTNTTGTHVHSGSVADPHVLTTAELPAHHHGLGITGVPQIGTNFGYTGITGVTGTPVTQTDDAGGGNSHGHTATIASDGSHLHSVTVSTISPYYALAYIMHIN